MIDGAAIERGRSPDGPQEGQAELESRRRSGRARPRPLQRGCNPIRSRCTRWDQCRSETLRPGGTRRHDHERGPNRVRQVAPRSGCLSVDGHTPRPFVPGETIGVAGFELRDLETRERTNLAVSRPRATPRLAAPINKGWRTQRKGSVRELVRNPEAFAGCADADATEPGRYRQSLDRSVKCGFPG